MPEARTGGQGGQAGRRTPRPARRPAESQAQPASTSPARPAAKAAAGPAARPAARTAAPPPPGSRARQPPKSPARRAKSAARPTARSGGPSAATRAVSVEAWTVRTAPDRLSPAERAARGKAARAEVPRESHAAFDPPTGRPDPVALLDIHGRPRIPHLAPPRSPQNPP